MLTAWAELLLWNIIFFFQTKLQKITEHIPNV